MSVTRRKFLLGSAAAIAVPMVASSRVLGANDEVRLAMVGCGGRAQAHRSGFCSQKGVRYVAVCDPDRSRAAGMARSIEAQYHYKPDEVLDVRRLMDRKDFDAVTVSTMQYWHALPTIWACQTGRDVYVEKPLAHFIWEGRQMVNAARKYNRLVQVGMLGRSRLTDRQAIDYIRSGQLGKIQYVVCFANKARTSIGKRDEPLPIPPEVDYDLWCGSARKEPIYRDRLQYDCSFLWNTGDGESCNQGVHEIDIARWLLGEKTLPRRVMSVGGRFVFNDAGNVPNTQIIYYDYPSAPILYEVHNLRAAPDSKSMMLYRGGRVDVCAQCEGGYVMLHAGVVYDNQGKEIKRFKGGESIFPNFIEAVRSRRREDLMADVLEGHLSTSITHAGNISYRLGKKAPPAAVKAQIGDLPVFQGLYDRLQEHLKAHSVDPGEAILGPWLECDPAHECFKDNAAANALVRGTYLKPFEVPDIVL